MYRERERESMYRPHLLQKVCLFDGLEDALFRRVLDLSAHQELVQDEVGLLEVKDDVQLAHLHTTETPDRKVSLSHESQAEHTRGTQSSPRLSA